MSASISFTISAPDPHTHLLAVEMKLLGLGEEAELVLRMPVWTPGSYLIREYSRHVQELMVVDKDGDQRPVEKIDKASWRIDVSSCDEVAVHYRVFAHDLTVRTNHLDGTHGFFNTVATCLYPEGRLQEPVEMEVVAPKGWEVFCGLKRLPGTAVRFRAPNFDVLFDSPVEMGPHEYFDFEVEGVPHRFVIWGESNIDLDALRRDVPPIVAQNAEMFGEIPYDRYVFINHLVDGKYGGLEHRHSSVNIYDARGFDRMERDESGNYGESYTNFLRLLSHEHFHAYHVKRLRPEALGPFDYQRENYTRALWAVEGVTSYFDTYNLLQGGLITAGRYIELLEKRISQLLQVPGRRLHSLEDAGFDAWIKLYRPDENTKNSSVSYYLKGEIVVWLIDLWIRRHSDGSRTMADALRRLWAEYYKSQDIGFPRGAGQDAVTKEAGRDAEELFQHLIRSCEAIKWEEFLAPVGLEVVPGDEERRGWLGLELKKGKGGRKEVKFVARHSPAEQAGIYPKDELVAIDGWSVRGRKVGETIAEVDPGEPIVVHVLRRARLLELEATAGVAPPKSFRIQKRDGASEGELKLLEGWLGTTSWEKQ